MKWHFAFLLRQFVDACGQGLGVNERLIKEDQQEYHDEMKANYRDLTRELSNIMHEQVGTPGTAKDVCYIIMTINSMICSSMTYCKIIFYVALWSLCVGKYVVLMVFVVKVLCNFITYSCNLEEMSTAAIFCSFTNHVSCLLLSLCWPEQIGW